MNEKLDGKAKELSAEQRDRLIEAERDFAKLIDEIKPFIKQHRKVGFPAIGTWKETSTLCH